MSSDLADADLADAVLADAVLADAVLADADLADADLADADLADAEIPATELVVLLDDSGRAVGTADKASVHTEHTPLHLAFSCYLGDVGGRVLLTRRALGKRTWPGVWTNACCGHPGPGEGVEEAVIRRVRQELGVEPVGLTAVLPDFRYRAVDVAGIVENEVCPVFAATVDGALTPDPAEVADATWVRWPDLVATAAHAPALLSPWSVLQVTALAAAGWRPPVA